MGIREHNWWAKGAKMTNFVSSRSKAFRIDSLVLALFCLLTASCDLPPGLENGKGSLTIVLPGAKAPDQNSMARAVHLPEPITDNMSYTLDFYNSGRSFLIGPTRDKVITVELEPGFWDIAAIAYYGADTATAALDKKPRVEIRAGQMNSISFTMSADEFITPYRDGWSDQDMLIGPGDSPKTLSVTLKTPTVFSGIDGWTDSFSYRWYYYEGENGIPDYDTSGFFPDSSDTVSSSYIVDPNAIGAGTFHYYVEVANSFTYTPPGDGAPTKGTAKRSIPVADVVVGGGTQSYSVGDIGPGGGTVFYHDPAGFPSGGNLCHYLEAASTTYTSTAGWGADGTSIPGATGTAIGTGYGNTQAIVTVLSGLSETGTAAQLAWDHNEGGQSDWFLPSKDELGELYTSGVVGNLIFGSIWSSTEVDATKAWCGGDASPPVGYWQDSKTGPLGIHPIRAF
jgi:hypothetical protein